MTPLTVEPAGADEEAAIDRLLAAAPNAHFSQHPGWQQVPHADPNGRWLRLVTRPGEPCATALVRIRPLPIPGITLADIFRGPAAASPGALDRFLEALPGALAPFRPAAVRIDPYWSGEGAAEAAAILDRRGYRPMATPPWHVRSLEVPIDLDDEPLIASFKPATRRQVRKALRMEIRIEEGLDPSGLAAFARLYEAMSDTKGASPKRLPFFAGLAAFCRAWPARGFILSSWDGGDLLGAISVFTLGSRAIYGFGASSLLRPEIPKSHLLHFEAMRRARGRGCRLYDFGGFSEGVGEEGHRTAAQKINFFKSGFGGRPVDFVAAHELVVRPAAWGLLRAADRLRRRWRSDPAPEAAHEPPSPPATETETP